MIRAAGEKKVGQKETKEAARLLLLLGPRKGTKKRNLGCCLKIKSKRFKYKPRVQIQTKISKLNQALKSSQILEIKLKNKIRRS
jgi:hypothetical protein